MQQELWRGQTRAECMRKYLKLLLDGQAELGGVERGQVETERVATTGGIVGL